MPSRSAALFVSFAISAFVLLIVLLAMSPFTVVNAGHRGIVTRFGTVSEKVLDEGFHWISPFDQVREVDVRTQRYEVLSSAASKDLQSVTATVVMNYNLKPDEVNTLYQAIGLNYGESIITPAIQEAVKASTAKYTAEELITKREEVKDVMVHILRERLGTNFITVSDVSITNFEFSESFNAAIEAKVTAEQDALAAKNKLAQTEYEAQQTIVKAEAEAESIRIRAAALKDNQDLVALEAVEKWNGILPEYMLGEAVPFIDLK